MPSILDWQVLFFPAMVSDENSAGGFPCITGLFFPFAAFKICSLSLIFDNLIIMCLGVSHFGFILFEVLCASWICMSICYPSLRKFSAIISLNNLLVTFFLLFLGLLWCICWPTWFCPLSPLNSLHLFLFFPFFFDWTNSTSLYLS